MDDDELIARVRAALLEERKIPPKERFADMVRRGVIDEKGRVLLRMPQPPKKPRKSRKKPEA